MWRTVVVVLGVGACSAKEDAAPTPPQHEAPAPTPAPAPPRPAPPPPPPVTLRWSNVVQTDNCFFFSGPEGRDDRLANDVLVETLARDGNQVHVRIGTAIFDGGYVNGELVLVRKSKHDFEGPWTATETIRGRVREDGIKARYAYEECDLAAPPCPGRCKITGDVTFSRAP